MLLEGLEKASSLPGLLGDLCHSLDTRDPSSPLLLNTGTMTDCQILASPNIEVNLWTSCVYPGPHHFRDGSFLIATLSKPRLQGSELRLQQHFRWVTLRWDQEPLHGLLGRQLRRKLLHKVRRCSLPDRFHYHQLHESFESFPPRWDLELGHLMPSWSARCSGSARFGSSSMPACPALVPMRLCWAHSSFSLAQCSQTTHRQSSGECSEKTIFFTVGKKQS